MSFKAGNIADKTVIYYRGGEAKQGQEAREDRRIDAGPKAVARMERYRALGKHEFGPGDGGVPDIEIPRIDLPGNRTMVSGIGFVDIHGCKAAQTVSGPFYDLDAAVEFYKGFSTRVVQDFEDDLAGFGLPNEDGIVKIPDGLDMSPGSKAAEGMYALGLAMQHEVLNNLCLIQTPDYNGFACGCLTSFEARDGGKSMAPVFQLLMVPDCDVKYMAGLDDGPCGPNGDVAVTYVLELPKGMSPSEKMRKMMEDMKRAEAAEGPDNDGPSFG